MDGSHPRHLLRRLLKHSTGTKSELVACAWLSKKSEGNRIRGCNETVLLADPTRARFCTTLKGSIQPSSAFRWSLISSRHVHGRMPQRTWLAVANFQRDWSFRCYTASSFPAGGGDPALVRILVGWLDALKLPIPTRYVFCTHQLSRAIETALLHTKALRLNAQGPHRLAQCNDPCQKFGNWAPILPHNRSHQAWSCESNKMPHMAP